MKRKIELLSPARNLECGIEAIRHGADAVYIGGPAFGARAAAGNSTEDIASLCQYAHLFGAKVYVTFNTILKDEELEEAKTLVWKLYEVGIDALIVQDLAFMKMDLPPIPLHASTQMDNRDIEKVQFLENIGFSQIVLARELSLQEIKEICHAATVPIEVFIHGALCASYSGRCYASQYCFNRSANRGDCAQFCRLAFHLIDGNGSVVVENKHLLSLRDMNRTPSLESLLEAGVSSFKIEGRLKDVGYVKNITAHYRQQIDKIIAEKPHEYERSSYGASNINFTPNPSKSFNRGFTEYFLHGRTQDVHSFLTPKSLGEEVGVVERILPRSIKVKTPCQQEGVTFANGDGLCYFDQQQHLCGFRVNKAEGTTLYPAERISVPVGARLYRNHSAEFERKLTRPSAVRTLLVDIVLEEVENGYTLCFTDEAGRKAEQTFLIEKQQAEKPQREKITQQFRKLGATHFSARSVEIRVDSEPFIPLSILSQWQRVCIEMLTSQPFPASQTIDSPKNKKIAVPQKIDYTGNIYNHLSRAFYKENGAKDISPAFEAQATANAELMRTRHCILYALGYCKLNGKKLKTDGIKEPLSLQLPDGRQFPLSFDCKHCQMVVHSPHSFNTKG